MISLALEKAVANHPFVHGMAARHLHILSDAAMLTQFEAGQTIFHEGDIANRFYLIQTGRLSVETRTSRGEPVIIQTLTGGDVLGWSWLFAPYYWHFSAAALEPTRAVFFYGTRLRESCEEDPEFGFEVMRRVAVVVRQRLEATLRDAVELGSR